jgi:hypothetical protein
MNYNNDNMKRYPLLLSFHREVIFNADETGLFFRIEPKFLDEKKVLFLIFFFKKILILKIIIFFKKKTE